MKLIRQKDLRRGMLVVDVDSTEIGDLFEVVEECTDTQCLGVSLKSSDGFYEITKDEKGLNRFGRSTFAGNTPWFMPTKEEIELIKNRDK